MQKEMQMEIKKDEYKQMHIDGNTSVCGLIGNPVAHTLSPDIHNTLAEKMGQNLVYVPFQVEDGKLENAVKGADALSILGCNVTVPYKSDVIHFLNGIDPLAEKIGAVNTLVRNPDGGYKGYNTDMLGLERALDLVGIKIHGEDIVILGAGGAARAVSYLCAVRGASHIFQLNRNYEKAAAVADEINGETCREVVKPMRLDDHGLLPDKKMTVIQATSVGLSPHDGDVVISDDAFYGKIKDAFDLIYRPSETTFMKLAKSHGARAFNGLRMLVCQGVISYELWNDIKVDDETTDEIYNMLEEKLARQCEFARK